LVKVPRGDANPPNALGIAACEPAGPATPVTVPANKSRVRRRIIVLQAAQRRHNALGLPRRSKPPSVHDETTVDIDDLAGDEACV
jgi:hypothetical protein